MVPSSYLDYFIAAAGAAGVLIGLLFVAISLRSESIFGTDAPTRGRVLAGSSFTSLVNAFFLSIMAVIPTTNVGIVAIVLAVASLYNTVKLHRMALGRDPQYVILALSCAAYLAELAGGVFLTIRPHTVAVINGLCYVVVASFVAALSRAWDLIEGQHLVATRRTPDEP